MPTVPISITGGSYNVGSRPQSAQVTKNFYPQLADDPATYSKYILRSFPGLTLHSTAAQPDDRGLFVHRGTLYHIAGTKLYSVSRLGAHTELADVVAGGRCIFDGIGENIAWADNGRAFIYDGTTADEVDDPDLEMPNSLAHLNQRLIYDGTGARFGVSDVGDGSSIDGLNYATAEAKADDLVRVYVHEQTLYLLGEESTERWYDSGVGSPPFDRIEGGIIPVGLGALHSVASNDEFMFWLGDDREVYGASAAGHRRISNAHVSRAINRYVSVSDAFGWCFTWNGQNYYALTFPTADQTLCYPQGGQWFELSSGDAGGRWRGNSYAYAHGRHYVSDATTGRVFYMNEDAYTEGGARVLRERTSGPLHGGLVGAPGKPIEMARFELLMEVGVGDIAAPNTDPEVMLQFSDDGGRTWSTEQRGKVGKDGEYLTIVEWHGLGRSRSRMIRIRTSDAVPYTIFGAAADLEVAA